MKRKMQTNENKRRRVNNNIPNERDNTAQPFDTENNPFQLVYHIYLNIFPPGMNEENVYTFNIFFNGSLETTEFTRLFDASAIINLLFKKKNLIKKEDLSMVKIERYKSKKDNEECSICMEKFKSNQKIRTLGCSHYFHCRCVDGWFLNYDDRCPVCRVEVIKKDEQENKI